MLDVHRRTPRVAPDRVAPARATWPEDDLERRVLRSLDFAAAAVEDFGETGYVDEVRPALGFGPDKVVAEGAMLAYAVYGATDRPRVRDRVDALARLLVPLVRSEGALADLVLHPDRVFRRVVPHVLLTSLGHPDAAFDEVAADRCARVLSHAVDQPATVLAERRWVTTVWGRPLPPVPEVGPGTVLARPFDLLDGSREDPYGLTHLLFYLTDFGREPRARLERPVAALLADVEALVLRYLDHGDYDLVGELLMAWPQLHQPWSPGAAYAFRVLAHVEDEVGLLPCGNLDPQRLDSLSGAARRRYARAASYHTALVMGFLCAQALRPGAAPPAVVAGPGSSDEAWRSLRPLVGDHPGDWVAVLDRCPASERRVLTPTLCGLVVTGALRRQDLPALQEVLRAARRLGLPTDPLQVAGTDLLESLARATKGFRRVGPAG